MNEIEIHIIAYNEQIMLPFTIAHYKKMFGNPKITVHDNNSTDDTVAIAEREGATVIRFSTNGMNDGVHAQIKSQAAMSATARWVLCIDADEAALVTSDDLVELEARGVNAVQFQGWNVFDEVESPWEIKKPLGVICTAYSKPVLLRNHMFNAIQFAAGAHSVILTPKPGHETNWSKDEFKLLHYKHWSCEWNIRRSAELGSRQSDDNKNKGHSYHFAFPEKTHREYFDANFAQRVDIVDKRLV